MKTAVVYYSETGSTKKVADVIADELPGGVVAKPMAEAPDLSEFDLVFVGFPLHSFGPVDPAVEYLGSACAGKNVALFVMHSAPEGYPDLESWLNKCRSAAARAHLVDLFECQGELPAAVKAYMLGSGSPALEDWARNDNSQGQPDEAHLERARRFARKTYMLGLATMVEKLQQGGDQS